MYNIYGLNVCDIHKCLHIILNLFLPTAQNALCFSRNIYAIVVLMIVEKSKICPYDMPIMDIKTKTQYSIRFSVLLSLTFLFHFIVFVLMFFFQHISYCQNIYLIKSVFVFLSFEKLFTGIFSKGFRSIYKKTPRGLFCNRIKKRLRYRCFSVNFVKFV